MTAILSPSIKFQGLQVVDGVLVPLSLGYLETYAAGTNTPLATYADSTGLVPNPWPVRLDANGQANVWLGSSAYKFDLFDAAMVRIPGWPVDNIDPAAYSNDALLAQAIACFSGALPPDNPVSGQLWYQPSIDTLWQYSGASWSSVTKGTGIVNQLATAFTTSGTAPAFVLTPTTPILSYTSPQRFRVRFHANATAPTLNVSGVGAVNVKMLNTLGVKIAAVVYANALLDCEYDGTDFVVLNPCQPKGNGGYRNYRASCTGSSASITMAADLVTLRDAGGSYIELAGVSGALNTAASGAAGLDTGTIAASTWYHKFFIYNPATGGISTLCSLSATAPTLPSGYTHWMRMGAFRTDETANKYPFSMVWWNHLAEYVRVAATNLTAYPVVLTGNLASGSVSVAAAAPPTSYAAKVQLVSAAVANAQVHAGKSLADANGTSPQISAAAYGIACTAISSGTIVFATQGLIYAFSSGSASNTISVIGWEDAI